MRANYKLILIIGYTFLVFLLSSSALGFELEVRSPTIELAIPITPNITIPSCLDHRSCEECAGNHGCAWCESKRTCEDVQFIKFYKNCHNWKWAQCNVAGEYLIVISGMLILLALTIATVCVVRCIRKRQLLEREYKEELDLLVNENSMSTYDEESNDWKNSPRITYWPDSPESLDSPDSPDSLDSPRGIISGTKEKRKKKQKHVSWGPAVVTSINSEHSVDI